MDATPGDEPQLDRSVIEDLVAVFDGDRAIVVELIDVFSAEASGQIQTLREAARVDDGAVLAAVAHTVKSSAAALGAQRLSARCQEMERLVGSGAPVIAGPAAITTAAQAVIVAFEEALELLAVERCR